MYYKVVCCEDCKENVYKSAAWFAQTEYKIGEWVYSPNNTGLFVFKELSHAQKFLAEFDSDIKTAIFSCMVKNPREMQFVAYSDTIKMFWDVINDARKKRINIKNSLEKFEYNICQKSPYGTYIANAVKLIKKVK